MAQHLVSRLHQFASYPQSLDNEYVPVTLLKQLAEQGIDDASEEGRERSRNSWRELIRSLLYSPQVVISREVAVNETAIIENVKGKKQEEALMALMSQEVPAHRGAIDRRNAQYSPIAFQIFSNENNFEEFVNSQMPTFPQEEKILKFWRKLLGQSGLQVSNAKLEPKHSTATQKRYHHFFYTLSLNEPAGDAAFDVYWSLFGKGGDREGEHKEFRAYIKKVEKWVQNHFGNSSNFRRTHVYNAWLYGQSPNFKPADNNQISRRRFQGAHRFAIPLKLMADLAYKANIPFQTGKVFISPEGYPDADKLPLALFRRTDETIYQENSDLEAYFDMLQQFAAITSAFQHSFLVPDWATVTLADVVDIRQWQSWRDLSFAQHELYENETLSAVQEKSKNYFDALQGFHRDLSANFDRRKWRSLFMKPMEMVAQVALFINEQPLSPAALEAVLHPAIHDGPSTQVAGEVISFGMEIVQWFCESQAAATRHHLDLRQRFLMKSGEVGEAALRKALKVQNALMEENRLKKLLQQSSSKATDASG